jgi:hypothetical protein
MGLVLAVVAAICVVSVAASPAQAAGNCNQTARVNRQIDYTALIPASAQNLDGLTCNLQQGMSGSAVQLLQHNLNVCYGAGLNPDGQFGPLTKAALQSAQSAEGISADGQYGPQTRAHLRWQVYENVSSFCRRITQPPSLYVASWPILSLPFPCGQTWRLSTYNGHGDYEIDMFRIGGTTADTPILAAGAGTVVKAGWDDGGGWHVRIDHGAWHTLYLHMRQAPAVSVGQSVPKGKLLGYVGSTGASSAPHLHYEQQRESPDADHRVKEEAVFWGVRSGITDDNASLYSSWPQFTSNNVCTPL